MSNNGDQELKIYEVTCRETGEKSYQPATSAEDACKQAGWLIGDCFVIAQKPRSQHMEKQEPLLLVKIPCEICPFQYAVCKKPPAEACPVQPNSPDIHEWLKQAAQAHLCDYYGQELSVKDYQLKQKWLPMADALTELSSKT